MSSFHIILDVVRKYMGPGDKMELEKLFASVANAIAEARLELRQRRDADSVSARQLSNDLDALEGLADDYRAGILG
jgi:hypothetical protein